jgi:hypothetical protein
VGDLKVTTAALEHKVEQAAAANEKLTRALKELSSKWRSCERKGISSRNAPGVWRRHKARVPRALVLLGGVATAGGGSSVDFRTTSTSTEAVPPSAKVLRVFALIGKTAIAGEVVNVAFHIVTPKQLSREHPPREVLRCGSLVLPRDRSWLQHTGRGKAPKLLIGRRAAPVPALVPAPALSLNQIPNPPWSYQHARPDNARARLNSPQDVLDMLNGES